MITNFWVAYRALAKLAPKLIPTRDLILFIVQILGFLAVLVGISFWSIPAALVVGGVVVIAAVELQSLGSRDDDPVSDELMRERIDDVLKQGKNPFRSGVAPMTPKWMQYVDFVTRPKTLPTGIKQ